MSKMLRKRLIPAEFMVASSLLLAPGFVPAGNGQNSTPTSQAPTSQASTPPAAAPATDASPSSMPITQPPTDATMPGIKQGSVNDVNAVGTRDIGGPVWVTGTPPKPKFAWASPTPCSWKRASSS